MLRIRQVTDPPLCYLCASIKAATHVLDASPGRLGMCPSCVSELALDLAQLTVADLEAAQAGIR